jgi:hypothetical protein
MATIPKILSYISGRTGMSLVFLADLQRMKQQSHAK